MKKIKLLLVDDEENFVKTLAERWRSAGSRPRWCCPARRPLAFMDKSVPDVIVLDLRMPGIDGMEVLRRVKKQKPDVRSSSSPATARTRTSRGHPHRRVRVPEEAGGHRRPHLQHQERLPEEGGEHLRCSRVRRGRGPQDVEQDLLDGGCGQDPGLAVPLRVSWWTTSATSWTRSRPARPAGPGGRRGLRRRPGPLRLASTTRTWWCWTSSFREGAAWSSSPRCARPGRWPRWCCSPAASSLATAVEA